MIFLQYYLIHSRCVSGLSNRPLTHPERIKKNLHHNYLSAEKKYCSYSNVNQFKRQSKKLISRLLWRLFLFHMFYFRLEVSRTMDRITLQSVQASFPPSNPRIRWIFLRKYMNWTNKQQHLVNVAQTSFGLLAESCEVHDVVRVSIEVALLSRIMSFPDCVVPFQVQPMDGNAEAD